MTITELASVAGFSQYHFHRIFAAMTGETLFSFLQRLRIERAAALLCTPNTQRTITQIGVDLGFSSSAVFSRTFKKHFGCSPSEFKNRNQSQKQSSLSKLLRNDGKANFHYKGDNEAIPLGNIKKWRFAMKSEVKIEKINKMKVAYIRYVGPYAGDSKLFENLYKRLFAWAMPRGIDGSTTYIMYHDDPKVTDEQKLRLSVCVPIADDTEVSGEICEMDLGGGDFAVGSFVLGSEDYSKAWDYMCGEWLPTSGYQPRDQMSFERYGSEGDKDGKMKVDICIPVEVV